MRMYFVSQVAQKAEGWPMGFYGNSCIDGQDYCLDTHNLKADEVPDVVSDAKTCSQFIAGLLNAYFKNQDATKMEPEEICRMGTYVEEEDVPKTDPNQKELPF